MTSDIFHLPGPEKNDYQCVLVDDIWHLTQEQSNPPMFKNGGAWTTCCKWATFKRGFDKRRPTCKACVDACIYDETYATYGNMTYPIETKEKEEK